jgi:DNA-binding MarR family transcriptional regulator
MRQIFLTPMSSGADQNDVTWAQRKILLMVEANGPQKMSDIARQISVTMSGATAVVDKMVHAGLVTRELSPADRRVVLIALSEKGRSVLQDTVRVQEKCFEAVLDRLTPEKREELLGSFERIHTLLSEIQTPIDESAEATRADAVLAPNGN